MDRGGGATILEQLFFGLGVLNSVCLIVIFVVRKYRMGLLRRIGWLYFVLAVPAIWAIVAAQQEHASWQYTVFLYIFLTFLAIEALRLDTQRSPSAKPRTGGGWCPTWRRTFPPTTGS